MGYGGFGEFCELETSNCKNESWIMLQKVQCIFSKVVKCKTCHLSQKVNYMCKKFILSLLA